MEILGIALVSIVKSSRCSQLVSLHHLINISNFLYCIKRYIRVLVAGLSDLPGDGMVKSYCPRCMEVYTPRSSRHQHTDGAYFGTGFPHMLFMVHPEYRPKKPSSCFVPKYVFVLDLLNIDD